MSAHGAGSAGESGRTPGARAIGEALRQAGLGAWAGCAERLWAFHGLLKAGDAELNLTRLRSFGAMVEGHYIDSLLPLLHCELQGTVMDLGSGGGFPGVPLAIARPDVRWVLVEGRRKRTDFLEQVAMSLRLSNVQVVPRKLNPRDCVPVDAMVARAVAPALDLLQRAERSVRAGGVAVLWKGPDCAAEVAEVAGSGVGFELERSVAYRLPVSGAERRLLVYRRTSAAAVESAESPAGAVFIESMDNARWKHWRELLTGRGQRKAGESLAAGGRLCAELLEEDPGVVLGVLLRARGRAVSPPSSVPLFELAPALFDVLDEAGTGGPIAWVRAPERPSWSGEVQPLSLLVATQQPENVGALVRSAEALGGDEVVLLAGAASAFHPRALRASSNAAFRVPIVQGPHMTALDAGVGEVWALDPQGMPLDGLELPARLGLLVGREGQGVAEAPASVRRVAIPMAGRAESLNAAVAGAIAMFEVMRRRRRS